MYKESRYKVMNQPIVVLHCMIGYCHNSVVCPSVRSSVCLWRCALCLSGLVYQRVPNRHVPICPFRHFCCRMYRLVTKMHRSRRKRESWVFFRNDHECIGL